MTPLLLTPLALSALLTPAQPAQTPPRPAAGQSVSAVAGPGAVWPLSPRPEIIRGFEPPPKPWLPGHRGLDLRGSPGQQVRSATPGRVTYAAPLAGRGVIVVTDGPLRTSYEPVVATIRVGTTVTPGTPLGHLSAAGSHCAPTTCLHWGLLNATTYLNPLSLLPHRPVRLLPLIPPQPHPARVQPSADSMPSSTISAEATPHSRSAALPPTPHSRSAALPDPHSRSAALSPDPQPRSPTSAAPPTTRTETQASPRGGLASGVIVGLAAAATLIGSVLIRRH